MNKELAQRILKKHTHYKQKSQYQDGVIAAMVEYAEEINVDYVKALKSTTSQIDLLEDLLTRQDKQILHLQSMFGNALNDAVSDTTGDDSNSSADNQKIISSCGKL